MNTIKKHFLLVFAALTFVCHNAHARNKIKITLYEDTPCTQNETSAYFHSLKYGATSGALCALVENYIIKNDTLLKLALWALASSTRNQIVTDMVKKHDLISNLFDSKTNANLWTAHHSRARVADWIAYLALKLYLHE